MAILIELQKVDHDELQRPPVLPLLLRTSNHQKEEERKQEKRMRAGSK